MRTMINLNNNWYYRPHYESNLEYSDFQGFETVNLPHTNLELPYNYFDETKKECNRVMDKIIELYKENDNGEELVKDIEKVYAMNHLSPRAKEFMKHSLGFIKGQ